MVRYTDSLEGISSDQLQGFFVGWRNPRSPEEHLTILRGSDYVVLAIDEATDRVVGFATGLTDGIQASFIPLLEVLPDYQGRGIGSELMQRMIAILDPVPCIDLMCNPDTQPFYEQLGMSRSVGMILRRYENADASSVPKGAAENS